MEFIFATNNPNKLFEIKNTLNKLHTVRGLKESGINTEIPEDFFTLKENAFQKAHFIFQKTGKNCFADDTGLEVDFLNGEPGVFSARYSRMGNIQFPKLQINEGNIKKLLLELEGQKNRKANFRTVVALILNGKTHYFEGIVNGTILTKPEGVKGFGYDPVFQPENYNISFAEMDISEKNKISHRAIAIQKLVHFLKQNNIS